MLFGFLLSQFGADRLDRPLCQRRRDGQMRALTDLRGAINHKAIKRVRPKIMTAATIVAGLLPIPWSRGAGAGVRKRIVAPMVGGVVTSVLMERPSTRRSTSSGGAEASSARPNVKGARWRTTN